MKILIICSRVPFPLKDGGAIAMHQMIKGLVKDGNKVSVLALNTKKHYVSESVYLEEFKDCSSFETVDIDTEIKPIKAFLSLLGNGSYNIERFWSKEFEEFLSSKVQTGNYDIVQFEGLFVSNYIHFIGDYKGLTCLRQHNIEHKIWEGLAQSEASLWKRSYLKILAKRMKHFELNILKHFNSVLAISSTDFNFLSKVYSGGLYLAPVGVEKSSIESTFSLKCYHIGSMEWLPNRDGVNWFLKEVWPKVVAKVPNAEFHLAGKSLTKSMFSESKGVYVHGEVESMEEFTKDKSLLIVPLLSGSGIRVKIIEALNQGKVVVSTRVGAAGIGQNSGIVLAESSSELAEEMISLLTDGAGWANKSREGKEFVYDNYNTSKIIHGLTEFYRDQLK